MVAVSPSILTNFESATKNHRHYLLVVIGLILKNETKIALLVTLSDFPPFLELYQIIRTPILPQTKIVFHRLNFMKVNYSFKLFHKLWI